jgi:hypothetical protein
MTDKELVKQILEFIEDCGYWALANEIREEFNVDKDGN